jgi:hypothetical protein
LRFVVLKRETENYSRVEKPNTTNKKPDGFIGSFRGVLIKRQQYFIATG